MRGLRAAAESALLGTRHEIGRHTDRGACGAGHHTGLRDDQEHEPSGSPAPTPKVPAVTLPQISLPHLPKAFRFDVPRVRDGHFEVRAEASHGVITCFDAIGGDVTANRVAAALRQIGAKPVTLQINSPGGDYFEGVAIYNLLRQHPQPITAQVLGVAASAASLMLMAAGRIEVARNAEIMIHEPWMIAMGPAEAMAQAERVLRQLTLSAADTYAARTGQPVDHVLAMMAEETFMRSDLALDLGFADALLERDAEPRLSAADSAAPQSKADLENELRRLGFAKAAAARLAAGGWPALRREPEADGLDLQQLAACLSRQTREIKAERA